MTTISTQDFVTMSHAVSTENYYPISTSSSTLPPSSDLSFQQAMPYVYTIVGFIGMTTNLFVLVIIATSQSLKKRLENGLIFNQSLLDCLSGLFLVLILTTKQQSDVHYSGVWGQLVCRVWMGQFPLWTTLQASIFSLVVITVERYLEVVHPIFYKVNRSRRVVWIMALTPWALALAVSIHVVVLLNGVSNDGECNTGIAWPSTAAMTANGVISLCLKFFIPVPVFIYCYTRMFLALKRGQAMTADRQESAPSGVKNTQSAIIPAMERARRNIIKTMLYISVAHTLCWSLNQVIYVAVMVSNIYVDYNGPLYNMSVIIIYINCCVNPIVFLTCYKAFKQDLIKRFCPSIKISPNSVVEFKSTALA